MLRRFQRILNKPHKARGKGSDALIVTGNNISNWRGAGLLRDPYNVIRQGRWVVHSEIIR
jgi:hypothetical protein